MKQTSELEGAALDAAVAEAAGEKGWVVRLVEGHDWTACYVPNGLGQLVPFMPSEQWEDGGPIIENQRITLGAPDLMKSGLWEAFIDPICRPIGPSTADIEGKYEGHGPTPLVAAMRAFVASKQGAAP